MEIITYILEGELEHQDSLGNGSIIRVGDVQRMSAGLGVTHSEFNPSDKQPVHLLQIWIHPEHTRIAPGYEQKHFAAADKRGRLRLIASHAGEDGSVVIHQDARVYAGLFDGAERADFPVAAAGVRGCRWRAARLRERYPSCGRRRRAHRRACATYAAGRRAGRGSAVRSAVARRSSTVRDCASRAGSDPPGAPRTAT